MQETINGINFFGHLIDTNTKEQVIQLSKEEWMKDAKIAIMPDAHVGKGTSIGTSIALNRKAISPNVVGVDIGCGVSVAILDGVTPEELQVSLDSLEAEMRKGIPTGFNTHEIAKRDFDFSNLVLPLSDSQKSYMNRSLGTLGGGNHFIEIGEYQGSVAIVVHSGSRNLGVKVHGYYQELAEELSNKGLIDYDNQTQELLQIYKDEGRFTEIESMLKDRLNNKPISNNLRDAEAYIKDENYDNYINDMKIAQRFAKLNREVMLHTALTSVGVATGKYIFIKDIFDSPHNYIDTKNHIIRKGAVSARAGERVVIPLSPSAGTAIGFGKGLADANYSAPHGAGRAMSRSEARSFLTVDDMSSAMNGIYSGAISEHTVDESPQAYKDSEIILYDIKDMVSVEGVVVPFYSFKDTK